MPKFLSGTGVTFDLAELLLDPALVSDSAKANEHTDEPEQQKKKVFQAFCKRCSATRP